MAEFLVLAKSMGSESWSQGYIDSLMPIPREHYDARMQIGDIITIKPDGWQWGTSECLPDFIVIKVPGISVDTVNHFREKITQEVPNPEDISGFRLRLVRERKYRVPPIVMNNLISQGKSVITLTKAAFIDKVEEKII